MASVEVLPSPANIAAATHQQTARRTFMIPPTPVRAGVVLTTPHETTLPEGGLSQRRVTAAKRVDARAAVILRPTRLSMSAIRSCGSASARPEAASRRRVLLRAVGVPRASAEARSLAVEARLLGDVARAGALARVAAVGIARSRTGT